MKPGLWHFVRTQGLRRGWLAWRAMSAWTDARKDIRAAIAQADASAPPTRVIHDRPYGDGGPGKRKHRKAKKR